MNQQQLPLPEELKDKKIAFFHAFFRNRGGAEEILLQMREYYNADLYTGALRWDVNNPQKKDQFCQRLFDDKYVFDWLHLDGTIPGLYHLKRLLFMACSPRRKKLLDYDVVVISGNTSFIQGYLRKHGVKVVMYVHTPPRPFADREKEISQKLPFFVRPFYKLLGKAVRARFKKDITQADVIAGNSKNIVKRIKTYLDVDADYDLFPPVRTDEFSYISTGDYFVTFSRLEVAKRIPLIVNAFAEMPDKKLVICGSGPLTEQVKEQIASQGLSNITFEGWVTDERLQELVGKCLAGIYIPINEDAGIAQVAVMSAGKPIIGVAEGGLLETIVDGKTGNLLPSNPTKKDLISAVKSITIKSSKSMKKSCIEQAELYSETVFYTKLNAIIKQALYKES